MWNLLKYLPNVIKNVRSQGYLYDVPKQTFMVELKRETGVLTDKTIAKWMRSLEELGYIHMKNYHTLELCNSMDAPGVFPSMEKNNGGK